MQKAINQWCFPPDDAASLGVHFDVDFHGALIAEVPPYSFCPQEGIRDISRKIDILCSLAEGTDDVSWD